VVPERKGQIYSVRYEAVNAMLLNEFLKQYQKVEEMQKTIGALTAQPQEQAAQVQKVSAQLRLTKPAPELVAHRHWSPIQLSAIMYSPLTSASTMQNCQLGTATYNNDAPWTVIFSLLRHSVFSPRLYTP
jgi:hypothetical protein